MIKQINLTKEFSQFILLKQNRNIQETHKKNILNEIKKSGYDITKPIIVTSDFEIVDGQHRFLACRELDVEFSYIFTDKTASEAIHDCNILSKRWSKSDFLHYYKSLDFPDYILADTICREHNETIERLFGLLLGATPGGGFESAFNSGKFKIKVNIKEINKLISDAHLILHYITEISGSKNHRFIDSKRFFDALTKCLKDGASVDVMKMKISMQLSKFHVCSSVNEYYKMLLDLYNYKLRVNKI